MLPLRVPQVHPQQVAREQRRLLAALAGFHLEDDVLVVHGVPRDQVLVQLLLELRPAAAQVLGLGRERRVLRGELAGGRLVGGRLLPLVVGLDHRADLAVAAGQRPGAVGVSVHG